MTNISVDLGNGADALTLNAVTIPGALSVTSEGITNAGALIIAGATTVSAGSNDVTLTQVANDFSSIAVTGTNVDITDTNAVVLAAIGATTLDVIAGGAVTQSAAAVVSGATTVTATGNDVTLTQAANNFSSIAVTGSNVDITDTNAVVLAAIGATTLDVVAGGAVTQ